MNRIRFFLVLVLSFCCAHTRAQPLLPELKCDSVSVAISGKFAIIYKGSKSGLYDIGNDSYHWPMSKSQIFDFGQFSGTELYIRLHECQLQGLAVQDSVEKTEFFDRKSLRFSSVNDPFDEHFNTGIFFNDMIYFDVKGALETVAEISYRDRMRGLTLDTLNRLVVHNYDKTFSANYADEEAVSLNGFCRTGIYDMNSRSWVITPLYEQINRINDYYFCSRFLEKTLVNTFIDVSYTYDVFDISGKKILGDVRRVGDSFLSHVLEVEKVQLDTAQGLCTTWKNGKMGLVRFQLMDRYFSEFADFHFQILANSEHDFVMGSAEFGKMICYNRYTHSPLTIYQLYDEYPRGKSYGLMKIDSVISGRTSAELRIAYDGTELLVVDDVQYMYLNLADTGYAICPSEGNQICYNDFFLDYYFSSPTDYYGISQILGEKLVARNFSEWEKNVSGEPVWDEERGETIYLDNEGNEIEPTYTPSVTKSGLYDIGQGRWIEPPNHATIHIGAHGFVQVDWEESENPESPNVFYSIKDNSSSEIAVETDLSALLQNDDLFQYIIPSLSRIDSVFPAPCHMKAHFKSPGDYYFFTSGDSIGICKVENYAGELNAKIISEPCEFVFYSETGNFRIYVADGWTSFYANDTVYSFDPDSQFEFTFDENPEGERHASLSAKRDTSITENYTLPFENPYIQNQTANIQLFNGKVLVLNNCVRLDEGNYFYDEINGGEYDLQLTMDTEASAVWEWDGRKWVKMTPYYAGINRVPCGFIVQSGKFYQRDLYFSPEMYDQSPVPVTVDIPERYFLLDTNYQAMFFGDWVDFDLVEDLGFGIAIWIQGKCAFIDYTGHAVTDFEWHFFEIENGKLKALCEQRYLYNEWGDILLDENGNEMVLSEEKIQYYELRD